MEADGVTRKSDQSDRYIDHNGNLVYITGSNGCWFAVRDTTRRVKSDELPLCRTRESAQANLDAYAVGHGWKVVKRNGNKD